MREPIVENRAATQHVDGSDIDLDAKWSNKGQIASLIDIVVKGSIETPALLPIFALLVLAWIVDLVQFGLYGFVVIVGAITIIGIVSTVTHSRRDRK